VLVTPAMGTSTAGQGVSSERVGGLDTIRFVCALWVMLGHLGFFPLVSRIDRDSLLGYAIAGAYGNVVSGPAAVIVFFVISGFCIHYPFRGGAPIPLKSYYARRYARVLLPMAAAILLGHPLGIHLGLLSDSILWSLVCEEIYYLIYPALLWIRRSIGLKPLLAAAFVAGYAVVVIKDPHAGNYPSYGFALNWVLGLPCWLFGCALAEADWGKTPSTREIWAWRGGVWFASFVCSVLRFHSPLKYPWTLNVFAILAAVWLAKELSRAREVAPSPLLEGAGKMSYSIYLAHLHADAIWARLHVPYLGDVLQWIVTTSFALGICYAFYRVVEKPSHELARAIGRRLLAATPASAVSAAAR
jgi:peptidoglycan/LPS O-acetylase OafA/YrhL